MTGMDKSGHDQAQCMTPDLTRVFVVGFARSGTTLLQSLLTENQDLVSFRESHFFFRGFLCPLDHVFASPRLSEGLCFPRPGIPLTGLLEAFCRDNRRSCDGISQQGMDRDACVRGFIRLLDEAAQSAGACGWVEKTPAHLRRIVHINRHVPGARFVHIVRRFPAVLNSWQQAAKGHADSPFRRSPGRLRRGWLRDIRRTAYWLAHDRDNHFAVTYNTLCNEPGMAIRGILGFLGLTAPSRIRTEPTKAATLIGEEEFWKENNLRRVRPTPVLDRSAGQGTCEGLYERLLRQYHIADAV